MFQKNISRKNTLMIDTLITTQANVNLSCFNLPYPQSHVQTIETLELGVTLFKDNNRDSRGMVLVSL